MKILITGAASTQAYQLKNKLSQPDILLGDYAELPALLLKSGVMIALPNPAEASYVHKMLAICLDHQIEKVYPLETAEYDQLKEAELLFSEYGTTILSAPDDI